MSIQQATVTDDHDPHKNFDRMFWQGAARRRWAGRSRVTMSRVSICADPTPIPAAFCAKIPGHAIKLLDFMEIGWALQEPVWFLC
jgi:hypothetical protein